jgi:hypothetical protein
MPCAKIKEAIVQDRTPVWQRFGQLLPSCHDHTLFVCHKQSIHTITSLHNRQLVTGAIEAQLLIGSSLNLTFASTPNVYAQA